MVLCSIFLEQAGSLGAALLCTLKLCRPPCNVNEQGSNPFAPSKLSPVLGGGGGALGAAFLAASTDVRLRKTSS